MSLFEGEREERGQAGGWEGGREGGREGRTWVVSKWEKPRRVCIIFACGINK